MKKIKDVIFLVELNTKFVLFQVNPFKYKSLLSNNSNYTNLNLITPDFTKLRKEWIKRNTSNLQESFLQHSKESVPFYSNLHSNYFLDFPQTNWKNFFSSNHRYSSIYNKSNSINYFSSGKTGVIMKMRWDPVGAYGCKFEILREQSELMELSLKNNQIGIVLIDDNPSYTERYLKLLFLNNSLYIRKVLGKSEKDDLELIEYLRINKIPLLCGKPRSLGRIMDLDRSIPLKNSKNRIRPHAIRSSGDNLESELRANLENWFKCNVYNFYKSQEGGAIAMDCSAKTGMHLFNKRVLLEVKDNNNIKPNGYGYAVITNFENWAMPFIRYEVNDLIHLEWTDCSCGYKGYSIKKISGSDSPYFRVNNKILNPSIFNKILETLPITQFQVTQKKDNRLVVQFTSKDKETGRNFFLNSIKKEIYKCANLEPSEVNVEKVDDLSKNHQKTLRYVSDYDNLN